MATYTTPGVYIDEVASPGSINGVPTWIAAYVGHTRPELAGVPALIASWSDFKSRFGAPVWRSYLAWAISQHFKEGGGPCYVVGAVETTAGVCAQVTVSETDPVVPSQTDKVTFSAASEGKWGNILWISVEESAVPTLLDISVCVRDCDLEDKSTDGDQKANSVSAMDRTLIRQFLVKNAISTQVKDLTAEGGGPNDQVYVLERFPGMSFKSAPELMSAINNKSSFVRIDVDAGSPAVPAGWYFLGEGAFTLTPLSSTGVTRVAGVDYVLDYAGALSRIQGIPGISLIATPDASAIPANSGGKLTDALSAIRNVVGVCGKQPTYWFYVVDPPATLNSSDVVSFKNGAYQGAGENPIVSPAAALYWPWIFVSHPTAANVIFPMPPSGAVIGRYVNTDLTVGVHQAAAGVQFGALSDVVSLDVDAPITDDEQGTVYPQGLNVIRNRIYYGVCIWGARTLSPDPAWIHVPVRRLFYFVEKSLIEGLQQFVFAVNNVHLWVSVSREITEFLVGLWKIGALFGRSQADAFRVTCDESNNTPTTIQQGYLNVKVEIAPVHPAEFIVIDISQKMASPDSGA